MRVCSQFCNSLFIIVSIVTSLIFNYSHGNSVYGDAVPLMRIDSGNDTLDKFLPKFYDCIEDAVKSSKSEQKDPYFKNEPTKNEVIKCYNEGKDEKSSKTREIDE